MIFRTSHALAASTAALVLAACGSSEPTQFSSSTASSGSASAGGAGGAGGAASSASSGQGGVGGETPTTSSATSAASSGVGGAGGAGGMGATTSAASSGSGGSGGAPVCASPGDTCSDCMFAQCNTVFCDCGASPGCAAIATCLAGCAAGDAACSQGCIDAQPSGVAEIALVGECSSTTCAAECDNPAPVDPCQVCLASQCEAELEACLAAPECVALIACVSLCAPGDQACLQTCGLQHLGGLAAGQALGNCSTASCSGICG